MYTHPDASDARRTRGAILTHQSLLALLTTHTIRPLVTPVPLGGKGMKRRDRKNKLVIKPNRGPKPQGPFRCPELTSFCIPWQFLELPEGWAGVALPAQGTSLTWRLLVSTPGPGRG